MTINALLVGLGNPGDQYKNTRHNVGFMAADALAESAGAPAFKRTAAASADVTAFDADDRRIIVAKPLTFMNMSGRAVRFLSDFYKIPPEMIFVFHDDIELDFARVKTKKGGGSAGHNGLRSIDNLIGKDYRRVRIGVGRPAERFMVPSHVLSDFLEEEKKVLPNVFSEIFRNISLLFDDGEQFESKINAAAAKN
ncbi:MAG: aminoacyl-tRNA hydrolase [Holosporaceae bacterium]|jgi:PTH1 family peptidyl-tRNA hydrolase|nr:aminoacyl-tRNA hydrolase [Holosporaceae bacterium]